MHACMEAFLVINYTLNFSRCSHYNVSFLLCILCSAIVKICLTRIHCLKLALCSLIMVNYTQCFFVFSALLYIASYTMVLSYLLVNYAINLSRCLILGGFLDCYHKSCTSLQCAIKMNIVRSLPIM